MPPLPADSIHARACKLKCEKILTRPALKFRIRFRVRRLHAVPQLVHRRAERIARAQNAFAKVFL